MGYGFVSVSSYLRMFLVFNFRAVMPEGVGSINRSIAIGGVA
jgi:hypothetical protein